MIHNTIYKEGKAMGATQKKEDERAKDQARAQLESIMEMIEELNKAIDADDDNARDKAEQTIQEDPLSVEIRSEWHVPGKVEGGGEYRILLCWGGPAVQIVGEMNEYNEPETAQLQYQDWFTVWTEYNTTDEEEEALLAYARCFYFEEF